MHAAFSFPSKLSLPPPMSFCTFTFLILSPIPPGESQWAVWGCLPELKHNAWIVRPGGILRTLTLPYCTMTLTLQVLTGMRSFFFFLLIDMKSEELERGNIIMPWNTEHTVVWTPWLGTFFTCWIPLKYQLAICHDFKEYGHEAVNACHHILTTLYCHTLLEFNKGII